MLLEYSSSFELCILPFRKKKLKKGKRSSLRESNCQNNSIILGINFQNDNGHTGTGLEPSTTSMTTHFMGAATAIIF